MAPDEERGRPGRAQPTMNHVAARAGVGLSTVSRVVNGDPHVSTAKSAAVQRAIEELGYRRNESARQFRTGATETVGLVIEDVTDPFFSQLSQSVEDVARDRGSMLLVASYRRENDRARQIIHSLSARRLEGIVVTPSERGDVSYYASELNSGLQMVFVDRPAPGHIADAVITDNRASCRDGVAHLIAQGHRRIACLTDRAHLYTTLERLAGYRDAIEAAGLTYDPVLVHSSVPDDGQHRVALARMLDSAAPPTAIFTCNNRATISVLKGLSLRDEKPALLGFDDLELAGSLTPGLSVIAQDPFAMGRIATEQLFQRIDGYRGPARTTMLPATLVTRGSAETGPPR
ncbi:LacI family DNA-binding transcriptional regulator [Paramicrobacterium chengjingii]|uniref:LacI family DNA-binding transcriptional regulator n=1 Tax=Paramicrobacterium chengjingii TaxID=2769067 RepID=A0ABX6YJW2_9MICO|nr:LacI family DNA-binding transcriptional regulator [Microbacterium chengjingii]QPZ39098.1 LacI family DNA-binding transcriptional regulator [Microbacterium chengjingii]